MKDGWWVWCPDCEQLCLARRSWFGLGKKLICKRCRKAVGKKNQLESWTCPNCGRTICGQADVIDNLSCPCGYLPAPVQSGEPQPKPEPVPELECPECSGQTERMQTPDAAEDAIKIFWNNAMGSKQRVYVHPHSSHIPSHSVLIVAANQIALYQAAGTYHPKAEGTYSLFWDELNESEIIQSLRPGEQSKAFPIQLNTQIIFFDTRQSDHQYAAEAPISLYGAGYRFLPEVRYRLRIINPELLMTNKFDYGTPSQSQALEGCIVRWAEEAIRTVIGNEVAQGFQASDGPALKHDVQRWLDELFDRHNFYDALTEKINEFLRRSNRGIELAGIDNINTDTGLKAEIPDDQAVTCPGCGEQVRKPVPGKRFTCPNPECQTVIWYCSNPECQHLNSWHPRNGEFPRFCAFCRGAMYLDD